MYKITEVREVLELPKHLTEVNHISLYILDNSKEVNDKQLLREEYSMARSSNRCVTLFKINDTEVWVKQDESKYWLDILPKVKNNRIYSWYIAGSISPFKDSNSSVRATAVDGYQITFLYNI